MGTPRRREGSIPLGKRAPLARPSPWLASPSRRLVSTIRRKPARSAGRRQLGAALPLPQGRGEKARRVTPATPESPSSRTTLRLPARTRSAPRPSRLPAVACAEGSVAAGIGPRPARLSAPRSRRSRAAGRSCRAAGAGWGPHLVEGEHEFPTVGGEFDASRPASEDLERLEALAEHRLDVRWGADPPERRVRPVGAPRSVGRGQRHLRDRTRLDVHLDLGSTLGERFAADREQA